ncbi:DUF2180 family protein [Actinomycetota bacterium Odt1-20B]
MGSRMKCYDCAQIGQLVDAVAVCRRCGGGICVAHASVTDEEVRHLTGMGLSHGPRSARRMTCTVCHEAESLVPATPAPHGTCADVGVRSQGVLDGSSSGDS